MILPFLPELGTYLWLLAILLTVNVVIFRRVLVSWVDPVLVVVLQTSFALLTALYSWLSQGTPDRAKIALVLLEHAGFILGVYAGTRAAASIAARRERDRPPATTAHHAAHQLRWVLAVSTALLLVVLLIRLRSGLFIFAEDPELARTQALAGGLGYLYRATHALSIVSVTALVALGIERARFPRLLRWLGWALPVMLTMTTGYKADLILLYAAAFFAVYFLRGREVRSLIRARTAWAVGLAIVGLSLFVLNRRFDALTGSTDYDTSVDFAVGALVERFVQNGSGLNYYLSSDGLLEFSRLGPTTFLWNYGVAPWLAPLGLVPYPVTLGRSLALLMTGDDTFGPNSTMYMEGLVYWGKLGAPLYCAALGAVLAFGRGLYPILRTFGSIPPAMALILSCYGVAIGLSLTVDLGLVVSGLVSFVSIVFPVLFGAWIFAAAFPPAPARAGLEHP